MRLFKFYNFCLKLSIQNCIVYECNQSIAFDYRDSKLLTRSVYLCNLYIYVIISNILVIIRVIIPKVKKNKEVYMYN